MSIDRINIVLPKGEALESCRIAAESDQGFELPQYDGLKLTETTQDAEITFAKPRDIPGIISAGYGDVGYVGTDVVLENGIGGVGSNKLLCTKFDEGEPMCRFSVFGLMPEGAIEIEKVLAADVRCNARMLTLATGLPSLLSTVSAVKELPFRPFNEFDITGSVEAMAKFLGLTGVADLVVTGNTAAENDLKEVMGLLDIYPESIRRICDE